MSLCLEKRNNDLLIKRAKYSEYVPQILRNYKKLKQTKLVGFQHFTILGAL